MEAPDAATQRTCRRPGESGCGAWSGGFLACLLFAATHGSLSAFGGLFTLAVCLNIAYERTGSLLVPIVVHAMFNLTSLLVLYGQAQTSAGR